MSKTTIANLPVPRVRFSALTDEQAAKWNAHTEHLATIATSAEFNASTVSVTDEVHALLENHDVTGIIERAHSALFTRILLRVWLADAAIAEKTMSADLIGLIAARSKLSNFGLTMLTRLFFEYFDTLDEASPQIFDALREWLVAEIAGKKSETDSDIVAFVRRTDPLLFTRNGPLLLARGLVEEQMDAGEWLRENRLLPYEDSAFARRVRDNYYFALLEAADPEDQNLPFLEVVTEETLLRQRMDDREAENIYFGHQVLLRLTDKKTLRPSNAWLDSVVRIAGDPREKQTLGWRRYWSRMPEPNRETAARWMQSLDLRAFLDGVEDYALKTHNKPMQRMLEVRKRLLEGLLDQGLIKDIRLILGAEIKSQIRKSSRMKITSWANLRDPGRQDTAVIYVDCGQFALIEGSHNYRIHIYLDGVPPELQDRTRRTFHGDDLRNYYPERHQRTHGFDKYAAFTHQGFWLYPVLNYLRDSGVVLDEQGLMSPNDFANLARRRKVDDDYEFI